jgi:hypothetical protein
METVERTPAPRPTAARRVARPGSQRRDAASARQAVQDRLANAQRVADAVEAYHKAADRIDAANAELASASTDRLGAIRGMRQCKLTISEIGALTGLSASRVQALSRDEVPTA